MKPKMCLDMRRYERLCKAEGKAENGSLPLIHSFLNKRVRVKVSEGLTVQGVLVKYQNGDKANHLPNILILKNENGYHILRATFENISEVKP